MLEQLLSKEVNDVSALMPQSVEELRKVIEGQQKEIQMLRKEVQELQHLRKENEEQARRITQLENQQKK